MPTFSSATGYMRVLSGNQRGTCKHRGCNRPAQIFQCGFWCGRSAFACCCNVSLMVSLGGGGGGGGAGLLGTASWCAGAPLWRQARACLLQSTCQALVVGVGEAYCWGTTATMPRCPHCRCGARTRLLARALPMQSDGASPCNSMAWCMTNTIQGRALGKMAHIPGPPPLQVGLAQEGHTTLIVLIVQGQSMMPMVLDQPFATTAS